LEAVVLHAIAKDPMDRYATADALAAAIRGALVVPHDPWSVRPAPRGSSGAEVAARHAETIPAPMPVGDRSSRAWVLICVVAALAGLALGTWLSLRAGQ
jgi:hypothetical protein